MKYLIALVILFILLLSTQIKPACGDLEHTPLDKMDTATQDFYITNCR